MVLLLPQRPTPKSKLLMPTVVPVLMMALLFLLVRGAVVAGGPGVLPGCPEACGSIAIPYPFGIGLGCSRLGFNLTCDETQDPPTLFMGDSVEVDAISLADGTVRVRTLIMDGSFSVNLTALAAAGVGKPSLNSSGLWSGGLTGTGVQQLAVSTRHNVFVAIGCHFIAHLVGDSDTATTGRGSNGVPHPMYYVSACAVLCETDDHSSWGDPCSGFGCCQTTIGRGLPAYGLLFKDLDQANGSAVGAFIFDREWFSGINVSASMDIPGMRWKDVHAYVHGDGIYPRPKVPTVLEWWLDVERDRDLLVFDEPLSGQRCISLNSLAFDVSYGSGTGYILRCHCSDGYQGNPYLVDGCQDIDECQQPAYPCVDGTTCINMPGAYLCREKKGFIKLSGLITVVAISGGLWLLLSLLGVAKINNKLKQQRVKKSRQKNFKKNHGLLLQQLISSNKDIAERTKLFSLEELGQATNKFHPNRILGGGGHGTVYKGILFDQRIVAIKKAKIVVQSEIDQFINEVVILSQTNHRNVVKLFGCCLEAEVPLLVYEFVSNGTLSFHLHGQTENHLSWQDRLRIALETARSIAYLHSAASISVYHRDIKCANILLTDTLTAKVSDFGASRSLAINETGILTAVQGTYGYLDPEYYYTSRLTEKSDVYSFGVILAELLTRVKPVFSSRSSEQTSLASYFVSLIRDNRLLDILDSKIVEEGAVDDAKIIARLAEACLSLKGEERPTMRQVETTLEDVHNSKAHLNSQTTRVNQNVVNDLSYKGIKANDGTRLYSLEKEFIQSSEIPR
ncbi:unnamed protein product [Triticum turgidum subsp. durum]|uniref:Protein kinase domain-containing protein n=1 Tax=Triticum turgidum subsp. durum TaxID=4567 RepID=A0A9R0W7I6_TRITD|nr:unnamed protein product [Triticum turgidum subsp. durum]